MYHQRTIEAIVSAYVYCKRINSQLDCRYQCHLTSIDKIVGENSQKKQKSKTVLKLLLPKHEGCSASDKMKGIFQ